jgi:DNA-binding transcriptional regulator YbjK
MPQESQDISPVFRIDVAQSASDTPVSQANSMQNEMAALLHQLVAGQDRQNELMEEMIEQMHAGQRQRASELTQWKEANPLLARRCRSAAEALSQVQTEFLQTLTIDVNDSHEEMIDSEFVLNEFVDRYGPRLAHLNGVLQLLSQLSANPADHR